MKTNLTKFLILIVLISTFCNLSYAQQEIDFTEITYNTQQLSDNYIELYFSKEFDKMSQYMHEDFSFEDPTATLIFGGELHSGKDSALKFFKSGYESILGMNPEFIRKIYSGEEAIYEMDLIWSFNVEKGKIIIDMPLVTILSLKDGKVIRHRDYGDYTVYQKQFSDQMKKLNE